MSFNDVNWLDDVLARARRRAVKKRRAIRTLDELQAFLTDHPLGQLMARCAAGVEEDRLDWVENHRDDNEISCPYGEPECTWTDPCTLCAEDQETEEGR